MRLSTKSRYGTRAVLDIALHYKNGPVTLKEMSRRQDVSRKYLGQIINHLLTADILESIRGPQGGYVLSRPPDSIRLGDIIRALDGSVAPSRCVDNPAVCERNAKCVTREVWTRVKESVESVIDETTVADLMARQKDLESLPL
jgi:Rrf2 family protein